MALTQAALQVIEATSERAHRAARTPPSHVAEANIPGMYEDLAETLRALSEEGLLYECSQPAQLVQEVSSYLSKTGFLELDPEADARVDSMLQKMDAQRDLRPLK